MNSLLNIIPDTVLEFHIKEMVKNPNFPEAFQKFHKLMRQTDFYPSIKVGDKHVEGYVDSVFYRFIEISQIPYRFFRLLIKILKLIDSPKA